jgi:cytochrome b
MSNETTDMGASGAHAGTVTRVDAAEQRLVWDLPLRLFHWLFATSVIASWATAKAGFEWMQWHIRLGYWMMGLLLFRVIWGFVGPRHARFSSFLARPAAIWRYAKSLTGVGQAIRSVGHNPLGGLMVILMLVLVAFQVGTGLFATDDIAWSGPYNPAVSGHTAGVLTSLHHLNFNIIWGAIGLHVIAIVYYAFVKKQNLVPAMLTGWKPAEAVPAHEAITSSELLKALIVIVLASGAVYGILRAAPPAVTGDLNLS